MPSKPTSGLGPIRVAAQRRADATSIRATAAEIGMSYTGFRAFLKGGKPHPETLRRLTAWYVAQRNEQAGAVAQEDLDAAMGIFVQYVRRASTRKMVRERIETLVDSLLGELDEQDRKVIVPQLLEGLSSLDASS